MREIIFLSSALALSMLGSYMVWTADESTVDDTAVMVYDAAPKDLASLTWDSEDVTAVVTRKTDAKGDYLWIETTSRTKKVRNPHGDTQAEESGDRQIDPEELEEILDEDDHGHDEEAEVPEGEEAAAEEAKEVEYDIEVTTKAFKGNKQADEMWESFAPLHAIRALSGDADEEAFGFSEPAGTITVARASGTPIVLTVGGETYGSKDKYVRRDGQERILLLDDAKLRPLQFAASRLTDRALIPLEAKEIRSFVLSQPSGATRTYTQVNADDPANAFWASEQKPDEADETAGTWIDKVFRMRLRNYTPDADKPDMLQPVFAYTVADESGESWKVEVLEATSAEGEKEWYAQSEHTRALVQIPESLASGVVDDLESLAP